MTTTRAMLALVCVAALGAAHARDMADLMNGGRHLESVVPQRSSQSANDMRRKLAKRVTAPGPGPNGLALTPPMGWMAWETFRCSIDCTANPTSCVNEQLFKTMTDLLVDGGYAAAGYNQISIDDCWANMERDENNKLKPNSTRFPNGLKSLSDYMHKKNVRFGLYSDIGNLTCEGYPGDKGFVESNAQQFAEWGVDYLKVDGCHSEMDWYAKGYPEMGQALQATGRDIIYSCSWPAYLGDDESTKPFDDMIQAGCNLWRNWADIQNHWDSLRTIIDHFGNFSAELQASAGPGHWHDMDMILAGSTHFDDKITPDQARVQMAIWSIMASPLMLSADLRIVTDEYKAIVLNREVIAVNQDPKGVAGVRLTDATDTQVWARPLHDGAFAVALYNRGEEAANISVNIASLFWDGKTHPVRDLFKQQDLGSFSGRFTTSVPATGVVFVKIAK